MPSHPPTRERLIQLDFVRGIAILAVMGFHFYSTPVRSSALTAGVWTLHRLGWLGVDLFFVLSGFLVGGLLVRELLQSGKLRVRRFLTRRALKIWPAYYAYLLMQVLLQRHPRSSFLWQNGLHLQNYAGTSLNHTWSLAVEEHFYLLLPVVLVVLYRFQVLQRRVPWILGSCCVLVLCGRCVGVWVFGSGDPQWKTHARLDSLLFGVLLSWWCYAQPALFARILQARWALVAMAVVALAFALQVSVHSPWMWSVGYTVNYLGLAALFLLLYDARGAWTQHLVYRAVAWVGLYSYGIYLWHLAVREPVLRLTTHLTGDLRWAALFGGQYLAAITLGVVMTKLVEFPMLRLRERLVPQAGAVPVRRVQPAEVVQAPEEVLGLTTVTA